MSGAHKITARGYRGIRRGYVAAYSTCGKTENARECTPNARALLSARRVYFGAGAGWEQTEAARLDAAIARNLKELWYGE